MTTVTIDYPTWDQVREGDLVTYEFGTPGKAGYTQRINNVTYYKERVTISTVPLQSWENGNWRIVKIVREVPDPLPDHPGAQVFTDHGVSHSSGNVRYRWSFAERAGSFDVSELPNPVEALPVPAKELRELLGKAADVNLDPIVVRNAALNLLQATRDEWNRAGIEESI